MNISRNRRVLGLLFGVFASGASNAAPILLDLEGTWGYDVGSEVPTDLLLDLLLIDQSIFGAWTGSVAFDPTNVFLDRELSTVDGDVIGGDYVDGTATASMRLANGAELAGTGATIRVVFDESFGGPAYSIRSDLSIPNGMFPTGFDAHFTSLDFVVGGTHAATDNPMLPPTMLANPLDVSIRGHLCGDFDSDGLADIQLECVQLVGDGRVSQRLVAVPEPGSLFLFLAGAAGFVVLRRSREIGRARGQINCDQM